MNRLIVNDVTVSGNRIDIDYSVKGDWEKFFILEEDFYLEYSKTIQQVPKNIAIIPFLCNFLPIAWVFDAEITIKEIDRDFYESIEKFKQGYKEMYPQLNFQGTLIAKEIIDNQAPVSELSAAFFSGGVDAYQTFISHIIEKPTLVTLWGSDIKLEDIEGWRNVENHTIQVATEYNLNYVTIKSSFRKFLNEELLSQFTYSRVKDGWWHGFQHGIGLIGHMAPYAYQNKIKNVYIGSTFTIEDKGKVTCASDPSIDNHVRFNGTQVFHDGYEFNRQSKIHHICEYVKRTGKKLNLRVCWQSQGGKNCCKCEKCYRTIYGIIAEQSNPNDFGFDYSKRDLLIINKEINNRLIFTQITTPLWKDIQKTFFQNKSFFEKNKDINWILKVNFDRINQKPLKILYRGFNFFRRHISLKKQFNKVWNK